MDTLRALVRSTCAAYQDRTAFVDADTGESLTFAAFERLTNQMANAFNSHGVSRGTPVAMLLENSLTWPVCEAALAKVGAVCVPLNYRLSPSEIGWHLSHSGSAVLVSGGNYLSVARSAIAHSGGDVALLGVDQELASSVFDVPLLGDLAAREASSYIFGDLAPEDPQRLMYTSATTGVPKGVWCPNVHIYENAETTLANQLSDMTADDAYLAATPMTHMAFGYTWPVFMRGARTIIARRYDPRQLSEQIQRLLVTHTLMAPTMITMLLRHLRASPEDARALRGGPLRRLWYAGSAMPLALVDEAETVLGPILGQQYGFTELFSAAPSMCATYLPPEEHVHRRGSCGRPLTGMEVRVVDGAGQPVPLGASGEIVVRATQPIGGYLDEPERTEETFGGGWIRPGDVGRFDKDGYLYITDRVKDMIISGGFNVYSAEVENVIMNHPDVEECAVVGMPHETWIEVPCAYVSLRGAGTVTEAEIIDWVRERLAHFKAPKRVVFRDELPKSVTGKILKRQLRDELRTAETTILPKGAADVR